MIILNEQNYFSQEANAEYMSASQLKAFLDCEACAIAQICGDYSRETTTALMVGSYVDAHFSKTLDLFKAQHPEILKRDMTLKAEYLQANEIIARIERDPLMSAMLSGNVQTVKTGEIEGVPFKIKIDSLLTSNQCANICVDFPEMAETMLIADGAIVDLKIMRDFKPIYKPGQGRLSFIEAWRYDLQLAIYQAVEGHHLPCFIAAATKDDVPDLALIHIPQYMLDAALDVQNIPYYQALKSGKGAAQRCEKCDYCKQTKIITGAISADEIMEDGNE